MKAAVLHFRSAAGASPVYVELPCYIRRWSLRCILLLLGSLLWEHIDASWKGLREVSGFHLTGSTKKDNPSLLVVSQRNGELPEHVRAFLARQNITRAHGAGVKVDLANEKKIDGNSYREVGGSCPVYGKHIVLYQPQRPPYNSNFLDDVPTEEEHRKYGNPLSGGFGMTMQTASKERFSPMPIDRLRKASSVITAQTDVGRCAQYAYQTQAISPVTKKKTDYRYPFVYDSEKGQCYLLYISMQQMLGKTYCSMYGDSSLTWYCFEPTKNPLKNKHLIYGSAYVGRDPEYYVNHCPDKALAGQKFAVMEDGICRDYTAFKEVLVREVSDKAACWTLAFTNEKVATDQPLGYEMWADSPWVNWLPHVGSNWPLSRGIGFNYAVFTTVNEKHICVLSNREPSCLITDPRAVSYTALSMLEEITLDYLSPSRDHYTSCDYNRCTRKWTREEHGVEVETQEVPCTEEERAQCKGNGLLIGGLGAAGVLIAAVVVGAIVYARKKKSARAPEEADERSIAFESEQQRRRTRQSDVMQEAEPSFWDEADEDTAEADQTNVMLETTD